MDLLIEIPPAMADQKSAIASRLISFSPSRRISSWMAADLDGSLSFSPSAVGSVSSELDILIP